MLLGFTNPALVSLCTDLGFTNPSLGLLHTDSGFINTGLVVSDTDTGFQNLDLVLLHTDTGFQNPKRVWWKHFRLSSYYSCVVAVRVSSIYAGAGLSYKIIFEFSSVIISPPVEPPNFSAKSLSNSKHS